MNTPIYRQTLCISPDDTAPDGTLRLSAVLRYAQQIAGAHCDTLGLGRESMNQTGLFWAIIRNRIEITRLPKAGQRIHLETWPMPTTRTAYPRATVAYDEAGKELFSCHSLWILMDIHSRAMVLPGKSGVNVEGIQRDLALTPPKSLSPITPAHRCRRQVAQEDLDINRHMNNARYLDWVDDILPSHCGILRSANLCYLNEAREGQQLELGWTEVTDGQLSVDITRPDPEGNADRIFSAKLDFEPVVL